MLTPFVLIRLAWLGLKNPDYWDRWPERFAYISFAGDDRPVIWIHAVSVGEVQAASPLVSSLLASYPRYQVLITTVTPTGADMVRRKFAESVLHYYLPYDLPHVVNRFIDIVQPAMLIVMETELWPNLYWRCHQQAIPIILVNARMSVRSFAGYKKLPMLIRQTLSKINMIATQSDTDGDRLISLGADPGKVIVTGNLKFDVNAPHSIAEQAQSLRRYFSVNRPIWIAASTHEGEENLIFQAHRQILTKHKNCLLIIAPRHLERFAKVAELSIKSGFKTLCKSACRACDNEVQVFVLDSLGELLVYYAASDVAFVGGSLLPFGGHNMLEPASLGVPVITGRHTQNFMDINRTLLDKGAAWQVSDIRQLTEKVALLLSDGNLRHHMGQLGKEMVEQNKGSTERIMTLIAENLLARTTL